MSTDDLARDVWQLLLQVTIEQHRERYERLANESDVSLPQAQAILELDPDRSVSMSVLAECLHNDPSNITGLVDRLEAKGLVERQAHPTDRRVKALVLTPSGRTVRARLRQLLDQPPPDFDRLDSAELARLRELLARLAGDDAPRMLAR
jgi:DNA-binding MarR family transcriptional regulator